MLIRYHPKDYPDREIIGLPVEQSTVRDKGSKRIRIFVLIPRESKNCDVDVLCEEDDEWRIEGVDTVFSTRPLTDDELDYSLSNQEQIEEDLYYVWDDGASQHPERAARLYTVFSATIEANAAKAKVIQETAYKKRGAQAQKDGWDTTLMPELNSNDLYGQIGPKAI